MVLVGFAGAEVYKELWKLLYKTLTEKYGIHNLIWEVNLYTYANSYEWYPGDEYVDIIGYDKYEGSPNTWGTSAASSLFATKPRQKLPVSPHPTVKPHGIGVQL